MSESLDIKIPKMDVKHLLPQLNKCSQLVLKREQVELDGGKGCVEFHTSPMDLASDCIASIDTTECN